MHFCTHSTICSGALLLLDLYLSSTLSCMRGHALPIFDVTNIPRGFPSFITDMTVISVRNPLGILVTSNIGTSITCCVHVILTHREGKPSPLLRPTSPLHTCILCCYIICYVMSHVRVFVSLFTQV